jgi:hypothetical protein
MTAEFRRIDAKPFAGAATPATLGRPPKLEWIAIADLVIDPEYQREIGRSGRANIIKIAAEFDWAKFAPVIVAPAGSNKFAVVDGQHRTTAAAICGAQKVPCAVIDGARAAQAAAFTAINTAVTAMSPMQVHAARLAAGDPKAVDLARICKEALVTICRYPIPANKMKAGETLAAAKFYSLLGKFGEDTFKAALTCITHTRDGYPGLLRSQLVEAFCVVLEAEPAWRDAGPKLLKAIQRIDLAKEFKEARQKTEGSRSGIISELVERLCDHLDKELGEAAA